MCYAPYRGEPAFSQYYRRDVDPFQLNNLLAGAQPGAPSAAELEALNRPLAEDVRCQGAACP